MKSRTKKLTIRTLKANPQYTRSYDAYWRNANGEAIDIYGNTIFVNKASDIRSGNAKYTKSIDIPNPFLTEFEKDRNEKFRKALEE